MQRAKVDLQLAVQDENTPSQKDFETWLTMVLAEHPKEMRCEISIRIVDNDESQNLNATYRGKDYATNVLSFPLELPDFIPNEVLGDLVIAKDVVAKEASEQCKDLRNHWTHLTMHGILHLMGYDHIEEDEAQIMEGLEIKLLAKLGITNPYETEN